MMFRDCKATAVCSAKKVVGGRCGKERDSTLRVYGLLAESYSILMRLRNIRRQISKERA